MTRKLLKVDGKFEAHKSFFEIQPLPTVGLVTEIKQVYKSVFDPKRKRISFNGSKKAIDGTKEYLEQIRFQSFIQNDVFESFWTDYGGFVVLDMPSESKGTPEPYFYIVPIDSVELYKYDASADKVDFLIYKTASNYIYVDKDSFIKFDLEKKFVSEHLHNVGCTPVEKLFIQDSVLKMEAGNLNLALFKTLDKEKLYNTNSNPITWYYKGDCNYNEGRDISCKNGKLFKRGDGAAEPTGRDCPKCSQDLSGAGTVLKVPMPQDDEKPLGEPIGFIFPQVENLKHNAEYAEGKMSDILRKLTGGDVIDSMGANNQAFNEKQVGAMLEARRSILTWFGEQIARIEGALITLVGKARYTDSFSCSVTYGNEFFNSTEQQAYTLYMEAVEGEASINMITQLYQDWIETKNRNNQAGYLRDKMIADLCPYFFKKEDKVMVLKDKGFASFEDAYLRLNFDDVLGQYEEANESIEILKDAKSYNNRIKEIKNEFNNIVKDITNELFSENQRKQQGGENV